MTALAISAERVDIKSVSASSWEEKSKGGWSDFPPELAADGNMAGKSSWRAEVHDEAKGEWLLLDLGSEQAVQRLNLAFLKGKERRYHFKIEISQDQSDWKEIFKGKSKGGANDFESFNVEMKARYIRITGYGNDSHKFPHWINIVEAEVMRKSGKV